MILVAQDFLSHPTDKVETMETQQIASLFATGGLAIELVYDGPMAGCPHCDENATCGLAAAA